MSNHVNRRGGGEQILEWKWSWNGGTLGESATSGTRQVLNYRPILEREWSWNDRTHKVKRAESDLAAAESAPRRIVK